MGMTLGHDLGLLESNPFLAHVDESFEDIHVELLPSQRSVFKYMIVFYNGFLVDLASFIIYGHTIHHLPLSSVGAALRTPLPPISESIDLTTGKSQMST